MTNIPQLLGGGRLGKFFQIMALIVLTDGPLVGRLSFYRFQS
jgi:hypothetical protein